MTSGLEWVKKVSKLSKPKLYLSEGYHMKFDTIASMLQLVCKSDLTSHSKEWVTNNMGISSRMVKCIANYCSATGLLKPRVYKPTLFGELVFENDPYVSDKGTLWLLHYIAASTTEFIIWNRLFNTILHEKPSVINSSEFYHYYDDLQETFTPSTIKTNVPSEINSLINAYCEQQFVKMGILSRTIDGIKSYKNQPLPIIIFYAFILLYKERYFQGATTIDVSFLTSELNSPGRIALLSPLHVRRLVEELHKEKLIQLESRADLDQIRFIANHSFLDAIKMYYRGNYEKSI